VERETLARYFEAGWSLARIAAAVNKDTSTIGKMAKRYGLEPVGRRRFSPKRIPRERLAMLVGEGLTLPQLAGELEVSITTVRKHLARHGLRTAWSARAEARSARLEAGGSQSMERHQMLVCRHHGVTRHQLEARGSYRCLRCRAEAVARRRRKVKAILVAEAGGCCRVCGYHRFAGALHFHHLDPAEKSYGLSYKGITISLDRLRAGGQEMRALML
jgi:hypothetical protein